MSVLAKSTRLYVQGVILACSALFQASASGVVVLEGADLLVFDARVG